MIDYRRLLRSKFEIMKSQTGIPHTPPVSDMNLILIITIVYPSYTCLSVPQIRLKTDWANVHVQIDLQILKPANFLHVLRHGGLDNSNMFYDLCDTFYRRSIDLKDFSRKFNYLSVKEWNFGLKNVPFQPLLSFFFSQFCQIFCNETCSTNQ